MSTSVYLLAAGCRYCVVHVQPVLSSQSIFSALGGCSTSCLICAQVYTAASGKRHSQIITFLCSCINDSIGIKLKRIISLISTLTWQKRSIYLNWYICFIWNFKFITFPGNSKVAFYWAFSFQPPGRPSLTNSIKWEFFFIIIYFNTNHSYDICERSCCVIKLHNKNVAPSSADPDK